MATPDPIHVLRTSHDLFARLVGGLDATEVTQQSYADAWSIADTASHLGSQAEIFTAFLEAGLAGAELPGGDSFPPIWDRWNATPPLDQVGNSVAANEAFVSRMEGLSDEERASFAVELFGMTADVDGLASIRLSEHALHTWDVAVALDPSAVVPADAVALLVPTLPRMIGRALQPVEGGGIVTVRTTDPEGELTVSLDSGELLDEPSREEHATVTLPAEAYLRLVYGRMDPDHTPADVDGDAATLDALRRAFPGF